MRGNLKIHDEEGCGKTLTSKLSSSKINNKNKIHIYYKIHNYQETVQSIFAFLVFAAATLLDSGRSLLEKASEDGKGNEVQTSGVVIPGKARFFKLTPESLHKVENISIEVRYKNIFR